MGRSRPPPSATPARWAASSCAASPATTSSPQLAPAPGEVVLDKPGKGAFCETDLGLILRNRGIATLLVAGVTTEVCVHTTIREANDRGFRCIAIADACASYFPTFHAAGLAMIAAQGGDGGGIFGWVASSAAVLAALGKTAR